MYWLQDQLIDLVHESWLYAAPSALHEKARKSLLGKRWLRQNWLRSASNQLYDLAPRAFESEIKDHKWIICPYTQLTSVAIDISVEIYSFTIINTINRSRIAKLKKIIGDDRYRSIINKPSSEKKKVNTETTPLSLDETENDIEEHLISVGMIEILATARSINPVLADFCRFIFPKNLSIKDTKCPLLPLPIRHEFLQRVGISDE